jgi:hypothetical protein
MDNVQTAVNPPQVLLLPVSVTHHGRLLALRQAAAHPTPDLLKPGGFRVTIQVIVTIIGERPGARLVVVPANPRWRRCEAGKRDKRGSAADEFGQRSSTEPQGISTRCKPGAARHKGLRRGSHRA